MTDINLTAERCGTVHNIPIQFDMYYFDAKFDTGSSVTVISASVLYEEWDESNTKLLEELCAEKGCEPKEFKSASGHKIRGYPVIAQNVSVGENIFPFFKYYFIVGGRKEMSLIGDDFIDNCRYYHDPHGDINISAFDFDSYEIMPNGFLQSDELLTMIDNMASDA